MYLHVGGFTLVFVLAVGLLTNRFIKDKGVANAITIAVATALLCVAVYGYTGHPLYFE